MTTAACLVDLPSSAQGTPGLEVFLPENLCSGAEFYLMTQCQAQAKPMAIMGSRPWPHLGPSWLHLGCMLAHLGCILTHLVPSWLQIGHLGPTLALSWAILGSLGAHLGSSWALLGATNHAKTVGKTLFCDRTLKINKADAYFTILGPCCGHVGPSDAPSWAMLSEVGALLGSIYGQLVSFWAHVGPSWLPFGPLLSLC